MQVYEPLIQPVFAFAGLPEGGKATARLSRRNGPPSKLLLVPAKPTILSSSFYTPWQKVLLWRAHVSSATAHLATSIVNWRESVPTLPTGHLQ
ncbi:hypothetical protein M3J09_011000 [Ascochyta lentis]